MKKKRRKHLIHSSIQLKYITMSILPALILTIFCVYFLISVAKFTLQNQKESLTRELTAYEELIKQAEGRKLPRPILEHVNKLRSQMESTKRVFRNSYLNTIHEWNKAKILILVVFPTILFCIGALARIYSHRITGSMHRLTTCIDMLTEGKDIPQIKIRKEDEFQEIKKSLEKLRKKLTKEQGHIN